ncbi:hypothetical protein IKQ02_03745 [bacterium]|nr:hypothetical protein [bacterium]
MASNKIYHYFVEGECEEKLINTYKTSPYYYFQSGKVEVFNFINKEISKQRIIALNKNTIVILVYDIDIENMKTFEGNIKKLDQAGFKVYHIQSIKRFEDEIVYSTNLKNINKMFNTESYDEFKHRFINQSDIDKKLERVGFDKDKIWSRSNTNKPFKKYFKIEAINLIRKK